ncbi:MAG: hypothetical protein LBH65_02630 [Desulfovibrio sp.]|jgi:hypothetical protein|nr:hypothetical protein [Desulfovibrio sp.]
MPSAPEAAQGREKLLTILDPGMAQTFGHHYAYNTALLPAGRAAGFTASCLVSRHFPRELLAGVPGAVPVFEKNFYTELARAQGSAQALKETAEDFAHALAKSPARNLGAGDILFAHSFDAARILGTALWYKEAGNDVPALALNAMLGFNGRDDCRKTLAAACALLSPCKKTRLFGGTRAVAAILSDLCGKACAMLPSPLPDKLEGYRSQPERGPLFGILGDGRKGKNLHLLAPTILRYLSQGGRGGFVLQLTPTDEEATPHLLALHDVAARFPARVNLNFERLDDDAYFRQLGTLSAIILPYGAETYHRYRPSGLVVEATAMGVPLIAHKGGFAEDETSGLNNGSVLLEDMSVGSLLTGLRLFAEESGRRRALGAEAAPAYSAGHGAGTVIKKLLPLG